MIQIWILMLIALGMGWIYEHVYIQDPIHSLKTQKISVVFIIMTIILGGFLGLRTSFNDTYTYRVGYEMIAELPAFWNTFDPSLSKDPGFNLCNAILKTLGVSTQNWLMIYSLITTGLYLHFIRKHYNQLSLNIYLFFCVGAFTFTAAAIKQSMATAICLCALTLAEEKKWIRYCLLIFLASTFHMYALIFLIVPFLMFKPWTKRTLLLVIGTVIIAFSLERMFGTINSITNALGESYSSTEFSGEGVNIFRVLVCNVPIMLAVFFHKEIFEKSTKKENLMFNLSMVNGCIMFIGIFGTANYFARLANYFVMAQAITLPNMVNKLNARNRKFVKISMIIGYLLFFYYDCNIVYGRFNQLFRRLTVMEYLQQLF
ncbi:hypothetical protein JCM31739_18950 [Faecalimonas canis]